MRVSGGEGALPRPHPQGHTPHLPPCRAVAPFLGRLGRNHTSCSVWPRQREPAFRACPVLPGCELPPAWPDGWLKSPGEFAQSKACAALSRRQDSHSSLISDNISTLPISSSFQPWPAAKSARRGAGSAAWPGQSGHSTAAAPTCLG